MTEPGAGSAVTDMTTKAEIRGEDCVINGQKIFCSGAHAHHFLVFVRFGPGIGGIGAVVVNRDTPGFKISVPHRHISTRRGASCSSTTPRSRSRTSSPPGTRSAN